MKCHGHAPKILEYLGWTLPGDVYMMQFLLISPSSEMCYRIWKYKKSSMFLTGAWEGWGLMKSIYQYWVAALLAQPAVWFNGSFPLKLICSYGNDVIREGSHYTAMDGYNSSTRGNFIKWSSNISLWIMDERLELWHGIAFSFSQKKNSFNFDRTILLEHSLQFLKHSQGQP